MRKILKTLIPVAAALGALSAGMTFSHADELEKVRLVSGNPVMVVSTPELYVPLAMGWWRDEGFDVEVLYAQGSSAGAQLMVGGSGEVGMINTIPIVVADSKGAADIRAVSVITNTVWQIVTLKDGGVTNAADLKGKTVGLAVPGPGGAMYLNALLKKVGVNPGEVRQVVSGVGLQSLEALRKGSIDAFLTYRPDIVQLEVLGGEFNALYDEAWLRFPDYGLVATKQAIDENPDMVEAIARGVSKANIFMNENPACVARIYGKDYAAQAGQRSAEQDTRIIAGQLADRDIPFAQTGGQLRGVVDPAGMDELQDFLVANGVIEKKLDTQNLIIDRPGFYERVNDFSVEEVKKQARECPGY